MKKTSIISALALGAAALFLLGACSAIPVDQQDEAETTTVVFNAGIGASDIVTKATAQAYNLVVGVFDDKGALVASVQKNAVFPAPVELNLAKGFTYKIVFWAQEDEIDWDADKLDEIPFVTSNRGGYDGFFHCIDYTVPLSGGILPQAITLKRPFAQVNFMIPVSEQTNFSIFNLVSVHTSNIPDNFNALTGHFSEDVHDYIEILYSGLYLNRSETIGGVDYICLASAFIPAEAQESKYDFDLTVASTDIENAHSNNFSFKDVRVLRNHRTNVIFTRN